MINEFFSNIKLSKIDNRYQKGFTLLELIIVFTVIALLSTVGVASFVDYSRVQIIQTAASNLESTLNMAKSRALSQTKPSGCNGILQGYEVVLDTVSNPNSYAIWAICPGVSIDPVNPFSATNKTVLPSSISFDTTNTTTYSIFFPIITSGVRGAGNIVLKGYNQSRWICVGSGGIVKISSSGCL